MNKANELMVTGKNPIKSAASNQRPCIAPYLQAGLLPLHLYIVNFAKQKCPIGI